MRVVLTMEGLVYMKSKNERLSLIAFRQNAPEACGFRDELIAYRKSLYNIWDYNAYVGILLGVGSPKHGDAACMNYAIGQGDNGKNTKKTMEERGLLPLFEKYKGKKFDESVLLSDVEDEIVSIVPEYEEIRQKFHEITMGRESQETESQPTDEWMDVSETEDSFAVHKEYYWGKETKGCYDYTRYGDVLYFRKGSSIFEYDMQRGVGRRFLATKGLASNLAIAANRHGLYVWEKCYRISNIRLYDYDANLIGNCVFPEDMTDKSWYIYEDEVVYSLIDQGDWKVVVYNIRKGRVTFEYDMKGLREYIDTCAKKNIAKQMKEMKQAFPSDKKYLTLLKRTDYVKRLYANKSYVIFCVDWLRNYDGYECYADMEICCDRRAFALSEKNTDSSDNWSVLRMRPGNRGIDNIKGYDMLQNRIWYSDGTGELKYRGIEPYNSENSKSAPIVSWYGKSNNEDVNNEFLNYLSSGSDNNFYFDGERAYWGKNYHLFYGMDSYGNGSEWNNSGHGAADYFAVLGDYVTVGLDVINFYGNGDEKFFPAEGYLGGESYWLVISKDKIEQWEKGNAKEIE